MKKIIFSFLMLCCVIAAVAQPSPGGGYTADSYEKLKACVQNAINNGIPTATIKLTADIYLKDEGELCSTFKGTLDGNGHTIYAGDETAHHDGRGLAHGKYLFTYSDGATFKNLTFKDFRADTQEHSNWSILTSQAKNGCVFENITFDHVSILSKYSNVGAVAGIASNCTFTNITVKNSDFTVYDNDAGAVVGTADNCTFIDIEVNTCEVTADDDEAGGVVGYSSNNCTFENVDIKNSFIKVNGVFVGGVTGKSEHSNYSNCVVDDQSCVCSDGDGSGATVGGITGVSEYDNIRNCINSALIAADNNNAGGIVGYTTTEDIIEDCLNTGMVVSVKKKKVESELYNRYKTAQMTCVTKSYKGKEYVVRISDLDGTGDSGFGGIVGGSWLRTNVSRCVNFGSMNKTEYSGGIVGRIDYEVNINDCLSDFIAPSDVYGIVSDPYDACIIHVNNCVDVSGNEKIEPSTGLSTIIVSQVFTKSDSQKIASGEICILLGDAWEQNIGVDPYPTPTGNGGLIFADNLDAEKYTYAGSTSNVTIKRTFDTDGWYSLCLPFSLTAEQTAEKFAQVAEFSEIDGDTYKFTTVDVMEAGKAYIVKVDAKLENPKFTSVTIAANVKADESGAFVGVLKPTVIGDGCKVIGSGTTVNPANAGTMKAFRAYFPESSSANARYFSVDDSEITSVESIKEGTSDDAIYNMQGIRVAEAKRGLYIVNGKKVFVK